MTYGATHLRRHTVLMSLRLSTKPSLTPFVTLAIPVFGRHKERWSKAMCRRPSTSMCASGLRPLSDDSVTRYCDTLGHLQWRFVHQMRVSTICDIVNPLPYSRGHRYILTFVDRFARWFDAAPLDDISAASVGRPFVSTWISRFKGPSSITRGRGCQF